jgi:iron complex outermembrane receptor protein
MEKTKQAVSQDMFNDSGFLPYWITGVSLLLATQIVFADSATSSDIFELPLEELMNIEVISTAKQAQPLADAASAVFVITQEDLRRTGVTNIPDALRMVPGMQVARIDANKWAVTARGFNGRFANKLLVLIDGRTVYTPTFSGVYWEVQDLLLEDIERIEVIRGPGASLWGANAVNGVINILTKHAADTQGGLVSLTVGNEERAIVGLRYGGQLGDNAFYRLYGKYLERDDLVNEQGDDSDDNWDLQRSGFRLDWNPTSQHTLNLQGDLYQGSLDETLTVPTLTPPYNQTTSDNIQVSGGFLQGRWEFTQSPTSQFQVQTYYQREERDETIARQELDTLDVDFQHNLSWGGHQDLVWGLGYRYTQDDFDDTTISSFTPSNRDTHLFSGFFQNTSRLLDDQVAITVGSKLEHNDYTGWEVQPSLRGLWALHPNHRLWAAVSRAVRIPSRSEHDGQLSTFSIPPMAPINLPATIVLTLDRGFNAEKLIAYELGYRFFPTNTASLDIAGFYYDYDDLRDLEFGTPFFAGGISSPYLVIPSFWNNALDSHIIGVEVAAAWRPRTRWQLHLAYSYLQSEIDGARTAEQIDPNSTTPSHQISLRSSHDLSDYFTLDVWLRYVDNLPDVPTIQRGIDDYLTFDLRLGWQPLRNLEVSLVGTNLIDPTHVEFVQELYSYPVQVERSIYGQLKWSF